MDKIWEIICKDRDTYYDYRNSQKTPVWQRVVLTFAFSLLISAFFKGPNESFLSAVISTQSILVGFSFSVLIFLLSGIQLAPSNSTILEHQVRVDRLHKMAPELFYNISYFNLVALVNVVLSLTVLLTTDLAFPSSFLDEKGLIDNAGCVVSFLLEAAMYFTLLDSLRSFMRTIRRLTFFFSEKIDLNQN